MHVIHFTSFCIMYALNITVSLGRKVQTATDSLKQEFTLVLTANIFTSIIK